MVITEFAVLAAMCAPAIHPTTLSAVVTQESRGNIYAIGINGEYQLPRQPRTLEDAIITAKQLKKDGHNFDAGLGQINVKNLEWLGMSIADLFDPCKNLKGVQIVLSNCYERAIPQFGDGQAALQAALICYNTGNFKRGFANGYVQKVASHVRIRVPELAPVDGKPQEPVQLRVVERGEAVQSLLTKTREGIDDVFECKTRCAQDMFSTDDVFSRDLE